MTRNVAYGCDWCGKEFWHDEEIPPLGPVVGYLRNPYFKLAAQKFEVRADVRWQAFTERALHCCQECFDKYFERVATFRPLPPPDDGGIEKKGL